MAAIRVMLSTIEEKPDFVVQLMASRKREEAERIFFDAARTYFAELLRRSDSQPQIRYASDLETALTFYSSAIVGVLIDASRKPSVDLDLLADQLLRLLSGELLPHMDKCED